MVSLRVVRHPLPWIVRARLVLLSLLMVVAATLAGWSVLLSVLLVFVGSTLQSCIGAGMLVLLVAAIYFSIKSSLITEEGLDHAE